MFHKIPTYLLVLYCGLCFALFFSTASEFYTLYKTSSDTLNQYDELLGGDFVAFYTGGKLISSGVDKLYDLKEQQDFRRSLSKDAKNLPFVYPALVAQLFKPLASFSFKYSYALWCVISLLLIVVSVELLISDPVTSQIISRKERALLFIGLSAFSPVTIDLIAGGQITGLGIFILSLTYFLLKRDRLFLAGVVFALTYYKPPLFLLLGLGLIYSEKRTFLYGCIASLLSLITIEFLLFGERYFYTYYHFIMTYLSGDALGLNGVIPANIGVGFYSLLTLYVPQIYSCIALIVFGLCCITLFYEKFYKRWELYFSSLVITSAALSFQVNDYDLSLLVIPITLCFIHFDTFSLPIQKLFVFSFVVVFLQVVSLIPESVLLPVLFVVVLWITFLNTSVLDQGEVA